MNISSRVGPPFSLRKPTPHFASETFDQRHTKDLRSGLYWQSYQERGATLNQPPENPLVQQAEHTEALLKKTEEALRRHQGQQRPQP
jgi:hypothetical protein